MSSFERLAAFIQWCEVPGAEVSTAFGTLSASAEKSRAAPPIPNTSIEAVPRISFLIIVISRVPKVDQIVELSFLTLSPQIAFRAGSCVRSELAGRRCGADGVGQRTVRPRIGRQINGPVVRYRAVSIADRSGTPSRSRDRGSCPLRPC